MRFCRSIGAHLQSRTVAIPLAGNSGSGTFSVLPAKVKQLALRVVSQFEIGPDNSGVVGSNRPSAKFTAHAFATNECRSALTQGAANTTYCSWNFSADKPLSDIGIGKGADANIGSDWQHSLDFFANRNDRVVNRTKIVYEIIANRFNFLLTRTLEEQVMPTGPNGQKRPADTNACAVTVARIAVGEAEDTVCAPTQNNKRGVAGAVARAEKLSGERRQQIAKRAAGARWSADMNTQMQIAKNRLFGEGGLGVSNVKLFPGSSREAMPEQMAEALNKALAQLEANDYELVDGLDD